VEIAVVARLDRAPVSQRADPVDGRPQPRRTIADRLAVTPIRV
jgi:hypothetical protein